MASETWSKPLYSPLPLSTHQLETRFLRIFRGRGDDKLRCSMFRSNLISIPYEALSYTWGTDERESPVVVNHIITGVTTNLHAALLALRRPTKSRIVWADALCINQDDNDERTAQVRQMGQIYRCAHRVVVWLGDGSDGSAEGLRLIRQQIDVWDEQPGSSYRPCDVPQNHSYYINRLLGSRYWTRVWIVQEIALAGPSPIVHCGKEALDWSQLTRFALNPTNIAMPASALLHQSKRDHIRLLQEIRDRARTHPRLRSTGNQTPAPDAVRALLVDDLFYLLEVTSSFEATDPRDKIFALLTMTRGTSAQVTVADYSRSVNRVLIDLVETAMSSSMSLDITSSRDLSSSSSKLPSWVPDFSTKTERVIRVPALDGFGCDDLHGSPGTPTGPTLDLHYTAGRDGARILVSAGLHVGTIRSIAPACVCSSGGDLSLRLGSKLCPVIQARQSLDAFRQFRFDRWRQRISSRTPLVIRGAFDYRTEETQHWAEALYLFKQRLTAVQNTPSDRRDLLAKPCSSASLLRSIKREFDLHELLLTPSLETPGLVLSQNSVDPRRYTELLEALDPNCSPWMILRLFLAALRYNSPFSSTLSQMQQHPLIHRAFCESDELDVRFEIIRNALQQEGTALPSSRNSLELTFLEALKAGRDVAVVQDALKGDLKLPTGTCPWPAEEPHSLEAIGSVVRDEHFLRTVMQLFCEVETDHGSLGFVAAIPEVRPGDKVVLFPNTSTLKLVRALPQDDLGEERHTLVGDVYIHWPDIEQQIRDDVKGERWRQFAIV